MKKLIFISCHLLTIHFLYSQTYPSKSCERLFTSSHLYTLSDECSAQVQGVFNKKENTILTETSPYKIFFRTNEPVNTSNCNSFLDIKKPIIIVEGFDFRKEIDVDDIYASNNINGNALDKLRDEGFDVITYNILNPVYSIETNARALTNFIDFINNQKQSSEELVIMGISMGGLLVRYTLTEMEINGKPHHTRLFVSFDAPQAGAYVPLSMQELVTSLNFDAFVLAATGLGGAELYPLFQLNTSLRSPAALEMLKYDNYNLDNGILYPNPCHESFMERLRAKNNNNGYPLNCKNVALTNGSFTGSRNNGFDQTGATPGNIALKFHIEGTPRNYELRTIAGNNDRWDQNMSIFKQSSRTTDFSIKENLYSFENAPGGFSDWYNIAIEVINAQPKMVLSEYHNNSSCFIPLISSLDLFTNNPMINLSSRTKQTVLNNSAFDDIYWNTNQSENTFHTQMTSDMSNYFFNQVMASGVGSDYCKSTNLTLSNLPNVNSQFFDATKSIKINNSTINSGSELSLKAGEAVTLSNGFWAKNGSSADVVISSCILRPIKHRPELIDIKVIESNVTNTLSSGLGPSLVFYQVDLEAQTTVPSNIEWLINNRNAGNNPRLTVKGNDGKVFTPNSYVKLNVTNGFQVGSWKRLISSSTLMQSRISENELQEQSKILLYPNPTNGVITIQASGSFIMNLLDINGKLLKEFKSDNSTDFDLNEYNSGSYIIKIQTASSSETFVIQLL